MAQYDIERVLTDIKSFLVSKLNTQISALNTEKNDGISLKTVDSTAYHLQSLQQRVDLMDPMIIYGEADEPVIQAIGPGTAVTYHVGVWVLLSDTGVDPNIVTRLLRYRRLLIDLVRAYWATAAGSIKMSIKASIPTPPFTDMETQYTGRAVGVMISLTIAE